MKPSKQCASGTGRPRSAHRVSQVPCRSAPVLMLRMRHATTDGLPVRGARRRPWDACRSAPRRAAAECTA
eukprot:366426-Chlamydomonas_euryale.AAC.20